MKIINSLDFFFPKIMKENNKITWIVEKGTEDKNLRIYGDFWYETFSKETANFAKDKAFIDIHSMSANEYIVSQLKYLHEENIRKNEYISHIYHDKIENKL